MGTQKHTPGPWVYPRDASKAPDLAIFSTVKPKTAVSEHGPVVAHVVMADPITGLLTKGEYEANARLIAAAPELLEALKLVVTRCGPNATDGKIALAAIAKAEGTK